MRRYALFVFVVLMALCTLSFGTSESLTVSSPNGSVLSSPAGINCPGTCTASFNSGTSVTLTETPSTGYTFLGWAYNGCAWGGATPNAGCTLTMPAAANSVTAVYAPTVPIQPSTWVDPWELICQAGAFCYPGSPGLSYTPANYELLLGPSGGTWLTGAPSVCTFVLANYANTFTGFTAAYSDMLTCSTANSTVGFYLDLPPGVYQATTQYGWVLQQYGTSLPNSPIVVRTSAYASLPAGQTLGTHGTQLNCSSTVSDPGIDNPTFDGGNMYFDCGPSNSAGVITGRTQVSVNTVGLPSQSITANASPQLAPLWNGYVSPTLGGTGTSCVTIDTGSNQECVIPVSGVNQTGIYAVFTKNHSPGYCVVYNYVGCGGTITNGTGAFVLANGTLTNTTFYNDLQYVAVIQAQSTGNSSALTACNANVTAAAPTCTYNIGPGMLHIQGILFKQYPGSSGQNYIAAVSSVNTATATSQLASHIHFEQDGFIGDWFSPLTGANNVSAGMELDAIYASLGDSYIVNILRPGSECHGVTAQGNTLLFFHNRISGCSIPIFSGGFGPGNPTIAGYVPFCDVQVAWNDLRNNFALLGMGTINATNYPPGNPNFASFNITSKNGLESKSGCRVVIYGNILGHIDGSGGQSGASMALDVRASSAGSSDSNYQAQLHDYTVWGNIFAHACSGFVFQNSGPAQGFGEAYQEQNILLANNLSFDISGTNYGCAVNTGTTMNGTGGTYQGTATIDAAGQHETFTALYDCDLTNCPGQIGSVVVTGGTCVTAGAMTFPTPNSCSGSGTCPGGNQAAASVKCSGSNFVVSMTNNGTGYTGTVAPLTFTCTGTGCSTTGTTVSVNLITNGVPLGTSVASITGYSVTSDVITVTTTTQSPQLQVGNQVVPLNLTATLANALNNNALTVTGATSTSFTAALTHANLSSTTDSGTLSGGTGFLAMNTVPGQPVPITQCANTTFNNVGSTLHTNTYIPSGIGPPASTGSAAWTGTFSSSNVTVTAPISSLVTATAGASETSGYCKVMTVQGGPGRAIQLVNNTEVSTSLRDLTSGNSYNNSVGDGPNFQQFTLFSDNIWIGGVDGWGSSPIGLGTPSEVYDFDSVNSLSTNQDLWVGQLTANYTSYNQNPLAPSSSAMAFPASTCAVGFNGTGAWAFGCTGNLVPINTPDYHAYALNPSGSYPTWGANVSAIDTAQMLKIWSPGSAIHGSPGPFPLGVVYPIYTPAPLLGNAH